MIKDTTIPTSTFQMIEKIKVKDINVRSTQAFILMKAVSMERESRFCFGFLLTSNSKQHREESPPIRKTPPSRY